MGCLRMEMYDKKKKCSAKDLAEFSQEIALSDFLQHLRMFVLEKATLPKQFDVS